MFQTVLTRLLVATLVSFAMALPAWAAPNSDDTAVRIDRQLAEELPNPQGTRVPLADDETFLRRVSLDLIGELPTPEQVTIFSLDPAEDKRTAAVDRLLGHPLFGQNWARYWRDVILSRRTEDRALLVSNPLVVYLTEELNRGTPWDQIARRFITATGDIRQDGETAIIVAQDGLTEETTAEISRIFLGIQIQCAQCHDHMTDRWKRTQFHELAAFFPRIAVRPQAGGGGRTLLVAADDQGRPGRKMNGRRGAPEHFMPDLENPADAGTEMKPVFFLTGQSLSSGTPDAERRSTVAEWMTESPWFAKAFVNRMWAEMVGEGFYEPIDDLGPDRTATAPKTIEYLAVQFVESGYDVKWLHRTIAVTEAYQRESRPRRLPTETPFAASCSQRLRADQLFNALTTALELGEPTGQNNARGYRGPQGPRGAFSLAFGYDPSLPRDEISGSIPQVLALMNSPQINSQIDGRSTRTMLGRLLAEIEDNEAVAVELYLRCLAREPSDNELKTCLAHVDESGGRAEAFEDVLWALINGTEFLHRR